MQFLKKNLKKWMLELNIFVFYIQEMHSNVIKNTCIWAKNVKTGQICT